MSQFYGTMQGSKSAKTCQGHKTQGLDATINGWGKGVRVRATYNEATEREEFAIFETTGSNRSGSDKLIQVIKSGSAPDNCPHCMKGITGDPDACPDCEQKL